MPTYGFQCPACGRFDVIRPMADASAPAACPTCGQDGRRTFGTPTLRALDPDLRCALLTLAKHEKTRDCLMLLEAVIETPGLVDRLSEVLRKDRDEGQRDKGTEGQRA